jgi:hypothetical protein
MAMDAAPVCDSRVRCNLPDRVPRPSQPDAFAQFALQLANKRVTGHHSLTYQSVSMRLYRLGRTETNRSLSPESVAFIDALDR